jgi:Tol biopolymer transport system component
MNRDNKSLIVILAVLVTGVVLTSVAVLYIVTRQQGHTDAAELGEAGGPPLALSRPTRESRIAYVTRDPDQDGFSAMDVVDADGSHRQRLVETEDGICLFPSWAPDGQKIAYFMHTAGEDGEFWGDDDLFEVWMAPLDGSAHVRISDVMPSIHQVHPFTWSPDGSRLAFLAEVEEDITDTLFVIRVDGSQVEHTIPLDFWAIEMMLWSPTGEELLFMPETDTTRMTVHVLSLEGELITPVYEVGMLDSWGWGVPLDWSPDGTVFAVADPFAQEVLIMSTDGAVRRVARIPKGFPVEIAWSPDGAYIAVSVSDDMLDAGYTSDMELHILGAETGEPTAVLEEEEGMMTLLDWSSDNSRLLYTRLIETPEGWLSAAGLWIYDITSGALEQLATGGEDGQVGQMGVWSP